MARVYDIHTNMDEDTLTEVGFAVYKKWIAFAMGLTELGGHRLENPTGRYASSIRLEGRGFNRVAVVADEEIAPEGRWLEEGHGPVDLKQLLVPGRTYPMHRGEAGSYGSAGYGPMRVSQSISAVKRNIWAAPRAAGFTGFATVPSVTEEGKFTSSGWIIPRMPAYSPAQHLKDLIATGDING